MRHSTSDDRGVSARNTATARGLASARGTYAGSSGINERTLSDIVLSPQASPIRQVVQPSLNISRLRGIAAECSSALQSRLQRRSSQLSPLDPSPTGN